MEGESRGGREEKRGEGSRPRRSSNPSSLSPIDYGIRRARSCSADGLIRSSNHTSNDNDGRNTGSISGRDRNSPPATSNPSTLSLVNDLIIDLAAITNLISEMDQTTLEDTEDILLRVRGVSNVLISSHDDQYIQLADTVAVQPLPPDDQYIRPADRAAVQQLPGVLISEEHINNDNNSTCAICRDPFRLGEDAREMHCGHMYHRTCIFRWLETGRTCPLCRYEMP